jgi:HAD superfamily hydrolase (TIGR01549 family)
MTKIILLDAANTLIHKPTLWQNILQVLIQNSFDVSIDALKEKHKIISELINFPDVTNEDFYNHFNAELLLALGILPSNHILQQLFKACSYLPWAAFDDDVFLNEINIPKMVLSNFSSKLTDILKEKVPVNFDKIIISENEQYRKPQIGFYELAIQKLNVLPHEILYVGDSLKLDVMPASAVGINAYLIDRENHFLNFTKRIQSFEQLKNLI